MRFFPGPKSRIRQEPPFHFWNFLQGLQSYYGILKDFLVHKFAHFKGLRLLFLSNFPEATLIQGFTSITESTVFVMK